MAVSSERFAWPLWQGGLRGGLILVITLACLAALSNPLLPQAWAHEIRPSVATLEVTPGGQRYTVTIITNLEAVITEIGEAHDDTAESPQAAEYDALRRLQPADLQARFETFRERFLDGVSIRFDGQAVRPNQLQLSIAPVGDVDLPRDTEIVMRGTVLAGARSLTWQWDSAFGSSVLRVVGSSGDLYTDWLRDGRESDPVPIEGPPDLSAHAVIAQYVEIGFLHIVPMGLDHILFVVGLFLLSPLLKPLFWQITAFTLAHSLTLALGMLGVLTLPGALVEPLIALSIVYICVENVFTQRLTLWRPALVFTFGLLHGLGFAGVLSEIGLARDDFILGLIAFNIGVEAGQIVVVLVCYAAVFMFLNQPWYRQRITIPASILIAVIGIYWTLERVFL